MVELDDLLDPEFESRVGRWCFFRLPKLRKGKYGSNLNGTAELSTSNFKIGPPLTTVHSLLKQNGLIMFFETV